MGLREINPKLSVISVRKKDTRPVCVEAAENLEGYKIIANRHPKYLDVY